MVKLESREEFIARALRKAQYGYFCNKCKRDHKPGTKVWERHLKLAAKVDPIIMNLADKIAKESEKRIEEMREKYKQERIIKMNKQLDEGLKTVPRYFLFDVTGSYPFRKMGRDDGYKTLQELYNENEYSMKQAKKGECILVILEAKLYKIHDYTKL